ncbi:Anaphase-promoting complex subunit 1 [Podila humilis]|nr:Anaphase-promoting complex subunit 1 [Podila humilis]
MDVTILGEYRHFGQAKARNSHRNHNRYELSATGSVHLEPIHEDSKPLLFPPTIDGVVDGRLNVATAPRGFDVELVVTKTKVTWSQGTVLRKVLDYSSEDATVIQALFVWFSESSEKRQTTTSTATTDDIPTDSSQQLRRQALVVILRGVARVYFHSGETHSVFIPVEIHKAWAMDLGLLIEIPYGKNPDMPRFYSILDPFEEFKAVKMVASPSSTHMQTTEDNNTLKHLSCMDPLHSIAVTVDIFQKRFRVWKYVSTIPPPIAVELEPNTNMIEVESEIRFPLSDATVFGAHTVDGSYVVCIFSKIRGKVDCYLVGEKVTMLWTKPAVDAISMQASRSNLKDVLVLTPPSQGPMLLLWTGYSSEFVPCQARVDRVVQLKDAVGDRVSLVLASGSVKRAQLDFVPRSSLVHQVLNSLSYVLPMDALLRLKNHFLRLEFSSCKDVNNVQAMGEWDHLTATLLAHIALHPPATDIARTSGSDWDAFLNSDTHHLLEVHPSFRRSSSALPRRSSNVFVDMIEKSKQQAVLDSSTTRPSLDGVLPEIIMAIHLVAEDRKLNLATCREGDPMTLLMLLCHLIGWQSWVYFYARYDTSGELISALEEIQLITLSNTQGDRPPPDLFHWLSKIVSSSPEEVTAPFPTPRSLGCHAGDAQLSFIQLENMPCVQTDKITKLFTTLTQDVDGEQAVVRALASDEFSSAYLDQLPFGVALPLREAISRCRRNPSPNLGPKALSFIGRNDLAELKSSKDPGQYTSIPSRRAESIMKMDVHSLCQDTSAKREEHELETTGTEIADSEVADLRFGADKRVAETQRMLQSSPILQVRAPDDTDMSEEVIRSSHQDLLRKLAQRTLALPVGRAILTFGTLSSNLPQGYPIPVITLSAKLIPSHGVAELDINTLGGEYALCWPQFHNGVAAGLRISPNSTDVKGSWVIYNRPQNLDSTHAGFLLALGLTGHLRVLSASQLYRYLTAEHEMTSTGLLLGLACAHRGTMDRTTTKQLALRIPGLLPPEAAALNLSVLDQVSCVLGIGLLYMETSNRGMAEVMLSEIGRIPQGDELQECHSLAAGFALGFVTLGQGNRQTELNDMRIVEVLMGHMPGSSYRSGLGRGSSGASVALGLMYIRTNDVLIADKLRAPDTQFDLDYFTPDALTLRIICRLLILWDSIVPTKIWVQAQVPRYLKSSNGGHPATETGRQSYYAILAGCCFALGLRFAGSSNETAYNCIISYVDLFRDLGRNAAAMVAAGSGRIDLLRRLRVLHKRATGEISYGSHMAYHMALGLLFVGGGGYTLGTSPSCVATLLCSFYPRFPTGPSDNRAHLQAFRHLWVLALEPRCLVTRETYTGICCSVPVRIHLKAAYFQSQPQLGFERRGSVTEDWVRSRQGQAPRFGTTSSVTNMRASIAGPMYSKQGVDSGVVMKDEVLETMTPCLLPELSLISKIEVLGPRYWPMTLDMVDEQVGRERLWRILKARSMAVIRHLGHLSYVEDPLGTRGILARPFPIVLDGKMMDDTRSRSSTHGMLANRLEQMARERDNTIQSHERQLQRTDNSGSYGEDFCSILLQDAQVTTFAAFLCRPARQENVGSELSLKVRMAPGLTSIDQDRDEARARFFTEVLYECITADKVEALSIHVWLYDISNQLETLGTVSMRTIWELRIIKNYYDSYLQRQRAIKRNDRRKRGVEHDEKGMTAAALDEEGNEFLVKARRIYELFAKITRKVEETTLWRAE